MVLLTKRNRYKFLVQFSLETVESVTHPSALLFSKIRLLNCGTFRVKTPAKQVKQHTVSWHSQYTFTCTITARSSDCVLEPCIARVSVRREEKGGATYKKLGFADLNLAEFAGCGLIVRRCILEGYNSRHRVDNLILTVKVNMRLLSGDPCFKVPVPRQITLPGDWVPESSVIASENLTVIMPRPASTKWQVIGCNGDFVTVAMKSSDEEPVLGEEMKSPMVNYRRRYVKKMITKAPCKRPLV